MPQKDYYKILGVDRGASADEIKRAYRKLAQQYHPDKGGDSERFKEVSEAYQVLADQQKRAQYDQFGTVGNGPGFGGSYDDIFRGGSQAGFGGFADIFESMFGQAFSQVQAEVRIKLSQALLGGTLHIQTNQGEPVELTLPSGTQDGQAFRFGGMGMPYRGGRGDLIVVVRIDYPKRLNAKQRAAIEQLRDAGL